jgi:hypothetical protein
MVGNCQFSFLVLQLFFCNYLKASKNERFYLFLLSLRFALAPSIEFNRLYRDCQVQCHESLNHAMNH